MKSAFLVFLYLFSTLIIADESGLSIKVDPPKPVKGESFNVTFSMASTSSEDPFVSFTPMGIEVLGRSQQTSLQTSIINGQFSSVRKVSIIYEMVANRSGEVHLRDIEVEIGKSKISHKPVTIPVLSERKQAADIFLKAEVSKSSIYLGEGIDIRYYLYYRMPVVQMEFKAFPKLNGFIKRFHKVEENEETVEFNGMIYKRSLKYSARAYPEKTGTISVDPLRLNISYVRGQSNPFGSFGLSFNRFNKKSVYSEKIPIEVKSLPATNVPTNFTGLVGRHQFNFTISKTKYLVNEAIEGRLEVSGPGALEKMDPPKIYQDPNLEQFDAKSEFTEVGMTSGKKTFDYTFLARADIKIPARDLALSYFDPNTSEYKEVILKVSELLVGGGSMVSQNSNSSNVISTAASGPAPVLGDQGQNFVYEINTPLFEGSWKGIPINWEKYLSLGLFIIILIQIGEYLTKNYVPRQEKTTADKIVKQMKKKGITYSELTGLISMLDPKAMISGKGLKKIIEGADLSERDKKYFVRLLDDLAQSDYGKDGKGKKSTRFKGSAFKNLLKVIKADNNLQSETI